jgi:nucleotide-binding universal stress UspA family protein
MKLLLAIDRSELSEAAVRTVIAQHRPQDTEVKVLHVIPVDAWDGQGSPARKLVDRSSAILRSAGFKVETTILKGATSDAIIDAAAEWDADLIVLGSHVRTAVKRFLFGSVSDAVVHQAHCSVELVRFRPLHCHRSLGMKALDHGNFVGDR